MHSSVTGNAGADYLHKDMAFIFLAVFLPVLCVAFPAVLLIEDENAIGQKLQQPFG